MAKSIADSVLDAALDKIATADLMTVCNAEPTTRTEAVTTFALADQAMVGGDYTKANGDTSGRKTTVAAKAGITVDTTGTGDHVALVDATELLLVTTAAVGVALTSGGTVDVSAFKDEIADPT